ncbi:TetR/AcrR family transcriptional regulator [Clostridium sp. AF19-22AC]|jgi:AcrR family transcriptional regulator|uniref:TetR/AcrR family transcriptional regulator n=1 Tax=Clostridia TaxID=186801 RepID=UPI000E4F92F6|nr:MULTISPECIES: TetR/AcrR family transcriptional regulator [Clostridia]RHR21612.1 TetR/AcrR family transcriptional regulator [Clostridium sp. AF19-22AC]
MNKNNGKIAEQSKIKLVNSLFAIMEQYNFEEITITQISQEAGLSRKTFYRLFKNKDELLNFYFKHLYNECFQQIKSKQIQHYWDVVQHYFDFCEGHKSLLLLLKQNNLLTRLFEGSYKYSFNVFEYVRTKEVKEEYSELLPYMLAYSIGGMFSMLLKWIESDMNIPSALLIEKLKIGFMSSNI